LPDVKHPPAPQPPGLGEHVGLIPPASGARNHLDANRKQLLEILRRPLGGDATAEERVRRPFPGPLHLVSVVPATPLAVRHFCRLPLF
jgi:hypothetical protein